MKMKINQLNDEVNEKNVKMQQLETENDKLHQQLVSRHQESKSVNKIDQVGVIVTTVARVKIYINCNKFIITTRDDACIRMNNPVYLSIFSST